MSDELKLLARSSLIPLRSVPKANGAPRVVYGWYTYARLADGNEVDLGIRDTEEEAIEAEVAYNDAHVPNWRMLRTVQERGGE